MGIVLLCALVDLCTIMLVGDRSGGGGGGCGSIFIDERDNLITLVLIN